MVKQYHHLSGEVKLTRLLTTPRRSKYAASAWVQVNLYADGQPLVDYNKYNIYLNGLKKSLEGSGKYLIICCGCGYAFCDAAGELWVDIRHHEEYIEWKHCENLPSGHYFFKKKQYRSIVEQLENEFNEYFKQYKRNLKSGIANYTIDIIKTLPMVLLNEAENM